jgi:D-sedoheptulose 7-phosphate isomerase
MQIKILRNISEHVSAVESMKKNGSLDILEKMSELIVRAIENGNKVLLAGNGGSASDAQHIAGEFIGRFLFDRNPLPAIALSTDTSVLTCVGNDYSFDNIFDRQVRALGKPGDIFWGLSTSGNSKNILLAAQSAKTIGMPCIGFSGKTGGTMKDVFDLCILADHQRSDRIQEVHALAYHCICEIVEYRLFKK